MSELKLKLGYPYTYGDNLSAQQANENLLRDINSISDNRKLTGKCALAFTTGFVIYSLTPASAYADDKLVAAAETTAKNVDVRRITNAIDCGAIISVCSKATDKGVPAAAEVASKNPKIAAAFLCGAVVAWCTKYLIFGKG